MNQVAKSEKEKKKKKSSQCENHVKATGGKIQARHVKSRINTTRVGAKHGLFILSNSGSIMFRSFVTLVIFGALCTLVHGQQTSDENCETLPFQLHLIKGFYFHKV